MRHTILRENLKTSSNERKLLKQHIIWPLMLLGLALRGEGLENILCLVTLFWNGGVKITLVGILFYVLMIIHLASFSILDSIG